MTPSREGAIRCEARSSLDLAFARVFMPERWLLLAVEANIRRAKTLDWKQDDGHDVSRRFEGGKAASSKE